MTTNCIKRLHTIILLLCVFCSSPFSHAQITSQKGKIKPPVLSISGYCGVLEAPPSCTLPNHFIFDNSANYIHNPELEYVDRFGNVHCKKIPLAKSKVIKSKGGLQLQPLAPIIPQPITPNYISPNGLFAVYLSNDTQSPPPIGVGFSSNSAARNVIAQIFADLEALIIENTGSGTIEPVKFELKSSSFNSGVLASASSYYDYNGLPPGTIIKGDVWNAINTGSNVADEWDGIIRVNFFHTWRTEINANQPGSGFDMYSVLLHEIMHALGFASGIGIDGLPKNNFSYLAYDQLIHTNTGVDLVDQSGNFNTSLLSTISTGCPTANAGTLRLGDDNRFVFSPSIFSNGSSLSHIDDGNNCSFPSSDYIMTPSIAIDNPKRLHPDEFGLLCELDYALSSSYGHSNVILFSNPATVTSNSNLSNVINYSGCTPLVVGVDDFDDPSTILTTDNCTGTTLQILESDLLSNDNSTLGLPLQVANLIALDGSTITSTGFAPNRTFTYTPSGFGSFQLRYQPVDNLNNFGNFTYVNIAVTSCTNFGCINTSTCNLICNPDVVDNGNCGTDCFYASFSSQSNSGCSGNTNFHVPGWSGMFSTPDWMPDINVNFCDDRNTIPLDIATGGRMSFLSVQNSTSTLVAQFRTEAITTNVNILPNTRYILSYHKTDGIDFNTINPNSNREPAIGLQVCLNSIDNNNLPSNDYLGYTHNTTTGVATCDNQYFQDTKFDLITDTSINSNWSQTISNFTSPNNTTLTTLTIYGLVDEDYFTTGNAYSTSTEVYHYQLDNFELIEDHIQDLPASYAVNCASSVNVGIELCTVTNMAFQWWDVTNNIQLTNGNTILNTSPLGTYSVTSTNNNGSTLEISNIYNTINLELRRVIPVQSPTGTPISNAMPTVDNIGATVINVIGGGAPNDAGFTFSEDASNCFNFDFQSTTLTAGDTHEWDFQNDGIIDATGTSTSFTFPANGDYNVTHIVNNDCGSLEETIVVTVDCSSSTSCLWPKNYGANTSLVERADAVVVDNLGNVFVHGTVEPTVTFDDGSTVPSGIFLAKYDNCGTLQWVKDVPLYGRNYSTMKIDNLGNPILLSTNALNSIESDITYRLTKFNNSNGNVLWSNSIEQYKFLNWPAFDIDMSTNEVYLLTNVNRYSKVKQANGVYIVNYTAPTNAYVYPRIQGHIIKFNASGNSIWQDHMIAQSGGAAFQDVVVAENTNRVYVAGYANDHPSPIGDIKFNSNSSIVMAPNNTFRLFLASFTTGGTLQYANVHASIQGYQTAMELAYSNTDNEIYLRNFHSLQLFNTSGNLISSTSLSGQSGQMYYDQVNNHLITAGTHSCNQLKLQKYIGTSLVWTYIKGSCSSKAYADQVFGDPTSDKIFMAGTYWNNDFSFSPTDVMPLAGERDAFISKIRDLGSTVSYAKQASTEDNVNILPEDDVIIYPNPSNGIYNFNVNSNHIGSTVEIFNYLGQIVFKGVFNANYYSIDLSSESSGIYKVVIKNTDTSFSKKIVKL